MKRIILFISLVSIWSISYANLGDPEGGVKKQGITVLVSRQDKDISLLSLNNQLFLTTMTTIQQINNNEIESFQFYLPDTDRYKSMITQHKLKSYNVVGFVDIKTKKEAKIPSIFLNVVQKKK